ncbi:DUF1775 domain-containing protein [Micromonospora aurantiaca]|nr:MULTISPECIES: DUF1775 domain-containing protein [Micromonospora]MCT2279083.1 DUF1775 domain-containing protein [Micromonospora chalcea]MDG4752743.1 DUF1775 domain-containing protein [Micromonospora sp. WMMD718]OHX06969.1 hypothetical protein BFV98_30375 [Micromonospora sp. WMMB235]RNH97388.1 DUF1775 domain-containing protein [Micromonospora aurantiaca]UFN92547.1 DUF1775 domain-containing protein [Micromonospora aurantiaca]
MRHRWAIVALAVTAATVTAASPAWAHTDAKLTPARAGAANAVLSVDAEAESRTAGTTSVQVYLPEGIAASDITLLKAPPGWKLSTTTPNSYTVAGPAVPVGQDAEHQVRVRQLPNTAQVSFKILQKYSDGRIDRWIEVPSSANPEPANPAPTVKLAAAPTPSPTGSAVEASSPSVAPATDAPITDGPAASTQQDAGNGGVWLVVGIVLALLAAAGIVVSLRRHRP